MDDAKPAAGIELVVYLGSILFFYSAHVGFESIMHVLPYMADAQGGEFHKLKLIQRHEYITRQVASLHSLIAADFAIYGTLWRCNVLADDRCLAVPLRAQTYLILLSSGFCTYDLVMCLVKLRYSVRVR